MTIELDASYRGLLALVLASGIGGALFLLFRDMPPLFFAKLVVVLLCARWMFLGGLS